MLNNNFYGGQLAAQYVLQVNPNVQAQLKDNYSEMWLLPVTRFPPPQTQKLTPLSSRNTQFLQTCAPHPWIDPEVVLVVLMVASMLCLTTALGFRKIASAHHA